MHGGAAGSGAPLGNKNAFKHGLCSREWREGRKMMTQRMREVRAMAEKLEARLAKNSAHTAGGE
jgi:hypothetical protein